MSAGSGHPFACAIRHDYGCREWLRPRVRDRQDLAKLERFAFESFGGTDVLFNNAGVLFTHARNATNQMSAA